MLYLLEELKDRELAHLWVELEVSRSQLEQHNAEGSLKVLTAVQRALPAGREEPPQRQSEREVPCVLWTLAKLCRGQGPEGERNAVAHLEEGRHSQSCHNHTSRTLLGKKANYCLTAAA
ncbi:unnamed protein product [Eretmochelys imbricata]